jgi:hypothetical protein
MYWNTTIWQWPPDLSTFLDVVQLAACLAEEFQGQLGVFLASGTINSIISTYFPVLNDFLLQMPGGLSVSWTEP